MAEDKLIKSGQFTFRRIVFLAVCGFILFGIVASGRLAFGYVLLTLALCLLLFVVMVDYGVTLDKVNLDAGASQSAPATVGVSEQASAPRSVEARQRKRSRPVKRRR